MGYRLAIDTGGTFTDAISVGDKGNFFTAKAPTSPEDYIIGTRNAIDALAGLNREDIQPFLGKVSSIIHGAAEALRRQKGQA